jgi:peptidoglycan/LPS O-acetylase OafA/YrhL
MAVVGAAAIGTMVSRGLINGTMAFGWVDNDLVRTAAGFFVGVLLERIHARLKAPGRAERLAWDAVAVGTAAAVMVYMASGSATNAADMGSCFVGFPLIITGVLRGQFVRSALQVRPLTYLGQISYSIYLVHFPLQLALHVASVGLSIPVSYGSVIVLGAYLLAVVVVASITYKAIEMPGKALLLGLRERRKLSASNAAR